MNLIDIVYQAVGGLRERRVRTILTILGIAVGTAPIVALVAATQGQSAAIQKQLDVLGPNTIVVQPARGSTFGSADASRIGTLAGVRHSVPAITGSGLAFVAAPNGSVEKLANVSVLGANFSELATVLPAFKLGTGTLSSSNPNGTLVGQSVSAPPGIVGGIGGLGTNFTLNATLGFGGPQGGGGFRGGDFSGFGGGAGGGGFRRGGGGAGGFGGRFNFNFSRFRIGRPVNHQGNMTVAAIAQPYGASALVDVDNTVFLPLQTAQSFFNETSGYNEVIVITNSADDVQTVQSEIQAAYPQANVFSSTQAVNSVQGVYAQVGILLASVAAIGVVVAGIGIANTMFVSVLERTTEIGILKAIGFTRGAIMASFLFEAITAGVVGGVFGSLMGAALSFGLGDYLNPQALAARGAIRGSSVAINAQPVFSWWLFAAVMLFAIVVAAIAGFLPSRKASRMDPVVALKRM